MVEGVKQCSSVAGRAKWNLCEKSTISFKHALHVKLAGRGADEVEKEDVKGSKSKTTPRRW